MTSWLRLFAITVAFPGLLVAIPNNDEASAASFTGLGHLPGDFYGVCAYGASRCSFATAVSADGKVAVGLSTSAAGEQAFRWESGVMTGLGDLPGGDFSSAAYGVSADGSVVVGRGVPSFRVSGGTDQAFRWENGVMTNLGGLPELPGQAPMTSQAFAVTADGSAVVGVSEYPLGGSEAVVWTAGGVVGLGDISTDFGFTSVATGVSADGSVVAGQGYSRSVEAFRWTQSDGMVGLGFLSPSGPFYSRATGISADGSVVVGASVVTGPENAFRWTQATGMVALTGPPIIASRANAASADGSVVVGYSYVGPVDSDAFIWDSVHGLRLVRDILVHDLGLTLTGWKLTEATGVSADGETVVGIGTNPSGDTEAWIANLGAQEVPMALTLPGALNLRSMGHWVTAYLQPPDGFDASAIDVSTIQLHGNVAGTNPVPVDQTAPTEIGDQNGDQIADLMVKFDRAAVELALTAGEAVPLTVTGTVAGQRFTGTTALKVLRAPITAPQGGSVLNAGTVCTVRWETPAEVSCQWVALLFSLDDGTNWTLVASGIPNSGSYDWMVPAAGSDLARVAVVLVESADATGDLVDGVLGVSEAFSIDALVGVNDRGPAQFALRGVTPNPAQHELRVSFSLGDSRAAKLALFDVSGRQMETRRVDGMGPGWHTVTLGGRSNLPVGLYVIRLTQDGRSLTTRAALVR